MIGDCHHGIPGELLCGACHAEDKVADLTRFFNEIIGSAPKPPVSLDDGLHIDTMGFDSLDLIELSMKLEEDFAILIPDEEVEGWVTVGDVRTTVRAKLGMHHG